MELKPFFSPAIDTLIGVVKTVGYWGSFFLFTYLSIPQDAAYLLVLLMVVDMVCGVLKAYRINGGNSITSHRATVGIIKKALVLIVLFTVAIVLKMTGGINPAPVLSGLIILFGMAEAYSIIGNAYAAYTLDILPEFEATSRVFKYLGMFFQERIEKAVAAKPQILPMDPVEKIDIDPTATPTNPEK